MDDAKSKSDGQTDEKNGRGLQTRRSIFTSYRTPRNQTSKL
jgi:hypothetical protein